MISGISFLIGMALVLSVHGAAAQRPKTTANDPAPWHVAKVAKLNTARGGGEAASAIPPQKYLQIEVRFNLPPKQQKKHKFRVTDQRGNEVGELWGWNDARSLVIFEGNWGSLKGLYLDAGGHREPLFRTAPVPPRVVGLRPAGPPPPGVVNRRPDDLTGQPARRIPVPDTPAYIVRPRQAVRRGGGTRYIDYSPDRVVHYGGGTEHVYHGPDRVVHYGGGTEHVYHESDRVVHHAGETTHVHHRDGGDRVVHHYHHGDTTHVHYGDGSGGEGDGSGAGEGSGSGPGVAGRAGVGEGSGAGEGPGAGEGDGAGTGAGEGRGEGEGAGPGEGPGVDPGQGAGPGEGPGSAQRPGSGGGAGPGQSPGEGAGPGSGEPCPCGDGEGPGGGPGPGLLGPGGAGRGGPGPGSPGGAGTLGGPGGPGECAPGGPGRYGPGEGPGSYGPLAGSAIKGLAPKPELPPAFVLYVATGDETGPGKVYQVNEHGRVLGWVNLPYTPTGLALHRNHGLVVALPRDGGRIMRIDDTGKVSTLLEKEKTLVHPVDVAVGGKSDTVLVADNIGDLLSATSTGGLKPKVYRRFEGQKWTAQSMSVAITNDKHVVFGTDGERGIYRFSGDDESASGAALLPGPGGVAADPKSLKWAATQDRNQIYVFEGEELIKKLRLPPNKSMYRNGLLSFSPCGSLCVAARDSDKAVGEPWLLMYDLDEDRIRSLFPWTHETMTDFVVGPRMLWDRKSPNTYKSIY